MGARGRLFISTGILLAIGGCATTQEPAKLVDVRPAKLGADPDAKPSDPLYLAAVSAIERRDYALALDALQAARARSPDDPRVWNAMGVVYDKLGRFDLSARYYAQAQELDPGSRIVSQNLAYSSVLQQKKAAETRALAAAAPQVAPPAVAVANPIAPVKVAEREAAPPPPAVPKVTGPAPASRSVAQVADSERAARLAAAGPVARWIAPVLEAFEPRPAAPAAAPVVPPAPVAVAQSAPAVARPAVPPEAPVTVARVTRPAVAAQTIPRAPAASDHALRLADVTGPLSRLAAPILDALTPEPATAARPEPAARAAPVQTVVLSATPHPAVAPAPAARVAAAAPAQPVTRAAPQRSIVIATRATTAPIRVATPTGRVTLARNTVAAGSLLGRPLMVVNASGRYGGAEPVRMKLASRGWTAPVSVVRPGSLRSTSTIRYASRNVVVAKALARTLPYGVRLVSCGTTCKGVTLFVGADALRWKGGAARTRTPIQYRGRA